jgi:plasmid stabilization system protein ParE
MPSASRKARQVLVSEYAELDLAEIEKWMIEAKGREKAIKIIRDLLNAIQSLNTLSERGSFIPESDILGLREYRQIYRNGFRVVYKVGKTDVTVMAILHERRDIAAALTNRLAP